MSEVTAFRVYGRVCARKRVMLLTTRDEAAAGRALGEAMQGMDAAYVVSTDPCAPIVLMVRSTYASFELSAPPSVPAQVIEIPRERA